MYMASLIVGRIADSLMANHLHLEDASTELARLFGQRLRERRIALNLTQSDLFDKTGVAASYISLIERGRANPSLDVLDALSKAIDSNVAEMLRNGPN